MVRRDLIFRVFVSSTFSDLIAERNALQEFVFPKLSEYCQRKGARFQAIDLRWGVSEEAAFDQQTMKICLKELRRCQHVSPRPNFIVLLGDRYGWRPLPSEIEATEFEALRAHIPEGQRAFVDEWYCRDDNAVPVEYYLRPRTVPNDAPAREMEAKQWISINRQLHALLMTAASLVFPDPDDPRRRRFEDSATHQEIRHGALESEDAAQHVHCYFRHINGMPEDETSSHFRDIINGGLDRDAVRRLVALKGSLRTHFQVPDDHVFCYSAEWNNGNPHADLVALCDRVERDLIPIIDAECASFERQTDLEREIDSHLEYAGERAEPFVGRAPQLERIGAYIDGRGSGRPLVVHGTAGVGKAAMLSRAIADASRRTPRPDVVARFVGTTPSSSDLRSLLRSLCQQLAACRGDDRPVPDGLRELEHDFSRRLHLGGGLLLIVLDSLEQLASVGDHDLHWLPSELPVHVRLIVSTLDSEGPDGGCYRTLTRLVPKDNFVPVGRLEAQEGEQLLKQWLQRVNRTLQPGQQQAILEGFAQSGLPLYLKLAFELAWRWRSSDPIPALRPDVPGIVRDTLDWLQDDRMHGRELTDRALGYLASSRHGLTEEELLKVLSADAAVLAAFHRRSPRSPTASLIPVVVWSRLRADLGSYLVERKADGTEVLSFYYPVVRDVVLNSVTDSALADMRSRLVAYFDGQPHEIPNPAGGGLPNYRQCSELPWLLSLLGRWPALATLLSKPGFFSPCYTAQKFDLLENWARLEVQGFTCREGYRTVLQSPDRYDTRFIWDLAGLFDARAEPTGALALWRSVIKRYEEGALKSDPGSTMALPFALCGRAKAEVELGRPQIADDLYGRAEQLARSAGNDLGLAAALSGRAVLLAKSRHLEAALSLFREEEKVCRAHGLFEALLECLRNQAAVLTHLGFLHEAHRLLHEQAHLAGTMNDPNEKGYALLALADLHVKVNVPTQALETVAHVIEVGKRYGLQLLLAQCDLVLQTLSLNPERPGPALNLAATNDLDWSECDERAIRTILAAVNQPNLRDRRGRTPLMAAACRGAYKLMTDLLKQGVQVNVHDCDRATALMLARRHHAGDHQLEVLLRSVGAVDEPQPSPVDTR